MKTKKSKVLLKFLSVFSVVTIFVTNLNFFSVSAYDVNESVIYNILETEDEKEVYNSLYEECINIDMSDADFERTSEISYSSAISTENLKEIIWLFIYDHPEFFWLEGSIRRTYSNFSTSVSLGIFEDFQKGTERNSAKQKLYDSKEIYLNEASEYSSDYEKVKYFHDTLINNITYQENDLDQSVYSALVNNQTVCTGYAKAFKMLCDESGINCISVQSYSHLWNKCFIDDKWYNVDLTNDDQKTLSYNYFLISDADLNQIDIDSGVNYTITITENGEEKTFSALMHTPDSSNFPNYWNKYPSSSETYDMENNTYSYIFGDVNNDGVITSSDAVSILVDYANFLLENKSLLKSEIADVNSDGFIDSKDATVILIYYANVMVDHTIESLKEFISSQLN